LQRRHHLLEHRSRLAVAAERLVRTGEVVECRHIGDVVGAGALGGGLGLLRLGERSGVVAGGVEVLKTLLRGSDVALLRRSAIEDRTRRERDEDNQTGQSAAPPHLHGSAPKLKKHELKQRAATAPAY
jgi:hypothetical protein